MLCTVIDLPNSSQIRRNYCYIQGKQFSLKPSESCQLQANRTVWNSKFKFEVPWDVKQCLPEFANLGILKSVLKFKTIHSVGYYGENNAILINSSYYTELKFYQKKRKVWENSYLVQHSLFGDVGSGFKIWFTDCWQHRQCYADGATYIQASQEHFNY